MRDLGGFSAAMDPCGLADCGWHVGRRPVHGGARLIAGLVTLLRSYELLAEGGCEVDEGDPEHELGVEEVDSYEAKMGATPS